MEKSESVLVGKVIEMRKITSEFSNLEAGRGVEVRHEGYIKCDGFERWVKFDPRKVGERNDKGFHVQAEVSVGDDVIFEISERSANGYPKAYRVRLEPKEKRGYFSAFNS